MAKLRKQKQGDQRAQSFPESPSHHSLAIVRHQKLCLRIDITEERIYGHTELKVVSPTAGIVSLHAHGLNIERVLFEGVTVHFEVSSLSQADFGEDSSCVLSDSTHVRSALDAANTAYVNYLVALEKELAPELVIYLPESSGPTCGTQDCALPSPVVVTEKEDAGEQATSEVAQEFGKDEDVAGLCEEKLKLVQVDYWLEKPISGVHFSGHALHTDNQLRRARSWFPCVDFDMQRCSYDMEFTVNSDYVAVSNGKLLYQVPSNEGLHLKTFVYKLDIPVAAHFISLIVAPLEVLPDCQNSSISHLCIPGSLSQLQYTVNFFHLVFSYYEDYLGASFPFGCYSHVFVDSESILSSVSIGASVVTLSSHLLVDERVIDQNIRTRIKLAHALAQQWFGVYITPSSASDAWLLEGLAGFLTDIFVKRHFGNNEACFRHYKANEAICKVDVEGFPPLSPPTCVSNLLGTERISILGRIRSWKAVAVIQMLEKQMGPEPFRKILQRIILRAQDPVRNLRTLSTKEFRHFANKLGNLERPFLKDFFPRWVESTGCPVLSMGFVYSKRRNIIELAVHRGCTATRDVAIETEDNLLKEKQRDSDTGWPGMMSIRVHEVDGMYDHPILPMAGDAYQLLEIQCHSKLGSRRIQRPKKGSKLESTEEIDPAPTVDSRQGLESPLLWVRADPQLEYLAEIHVHQPEQMWINQLEKDRDVVAQMQAITALAAFPQMSFPAINALNSCLNDLKVFCRVRIEAAFALANTTAEATGWAGLSHLLKFYKSRRYDPDIGLPRPNDFHDLAEYFVLQVIPGAVAAIRGSDGKSPPEAVDFILQLMKYNDNSGNQYSDVYWLSSLIQSIGKIEFSQQSLQILPRILKSIDRFLQYDRLMPSYNGLITISCIRTLTDMALKFSHFLPMDHIEQLLHPFIDARTTWWKVRLEAAQALCDLQFHLEGLDAGIKLALKLVYIDPSMKVQSKLFSHILHVCTVKEYTADSVSGATLSDLIQLLHSQKSFSNTFLRHHVFSVLQVLSGRPATLIRSTIPPVEPSAITGTVDSATQEPRNKFGPIKVRIQCPLESHSEPVSNHLVPTGLENSREAIPTASGSSSGKQVGDQKVGVLKLRFKPTTSAQQDEKSLVPEPVRSSSVSMEQGVKSQRIADESPHSIKYASFEWEETQKHGYSTTSMRESDSRLGYKYFENEMEESTVHLIQSKKTKNLQVAIDRIESDTGAPSSNQDLGLTTECSGDQQYKATHQEGTEIRLMLRLEDQGSSKLEAGTTDEGQQKETASEKRKEVKKKWKREKDKNEGTCNEYVRKQDKPDDPEYLEKKCLKKEHKRKEKELRHFQKYDENGAIKATKIDTNSTGKRAAVGTSETVVRIKFKNKL